MKHKDYMKIAMELAAEAEKRGDVPVGALVVKDGEIISRSFNCRESANSATAHAEILAIDAACRKLGRRRLNDCVLYVTLEPCPMCAGAVALAGFKTLVFGCGDSLWGGSGSVFNIVEHPATNGKTEVIAGIMEKECKEQLQAFFQKRRQEK